MKNIYFLYKWIKLFKNDEKCFLFHLKSSFRSQDIYIFVLTFWSCEKAAKDKLNFKMCDVTTWLTYIV